MSDDSQSLIVGVDGSPGSSAALRWALDEAMTSDRAITAVSVYPPDRLPAYDTRWGEQPSPRERRLRQQQLLDAQIAEVIQGTGRTVSLTRRVVAGEAVPVLLELALRQSTLVVGARGLGRFTRLLLGSVSAECAQYAEGSVVVVRHEEQQVAPNAPVVVGVDGSEESMTALRWAIDFARRHSAALRVLQAWSLPFTLHPGPLLPGLERERARAATELHQAVGAELQAISDPAPGLVEPEVALVEGSAPTVLIEAAAQARLLVVGSRGRGALASQVMGSTSLSCVTNAPCSVAVVRAQRPNDGDGQRASSR